MLFFAENADGKSSCTAINRGEAEAAPLIQQFQQCAKGIYSPRPAAAKNEILIRNITGFRNLTLVFGKNYNCS